MFFVFSYSLLIGQVFAFCNFIFRVSRHSMWLVQNLNLKQLHFSFFLANHIKTKLCDMKNVCKENPVGLSTTSRDASVVLCRNICFSKYKYPFESDGTFVTEFRWLLSVYRCQSQWNDCGKNMCGKIEYDFQRHLEMQVSDCVVLFVFLSTSTLLNPMRHSSQNFVGRVALCEKQDFESIMSRIRSHAELFFAHFVSILVLFVSVIRWHVGQSREMTELFFATFPDPFQTRF